ncbi:MAG: HAD family phosphatase [Eubacterium sp.]
MMNIYNYKGAIFDFDGTLVDSMDLWHEIDIAYLKRHGKLCPDDLPYEIAGKSFNETADYFKKRFDIPDSVEHIMEEWTTMSHDTYLLQIDFKPGALNLLKSLHQNGTKLAIATSNNRMTTEAYFKKHNAYNLFESMCFTGEVGKGKPDPSVFLEAARCLGASPNDCLAFEDTLEGVQAAKAAGMDTIAVADLWQGTQLEKIKILADDYILGFDDLIF